MFHEPTFHHEKSAQFLSVQWGEEEILVRETSAQFLNLPRLGGGARNC